MINDLKQETISDSIIVAWPIIMPNTCSVWAKTHSSSVFSGYEEYKTLILPQTRNHLLWSGGLFADLLSLLTDLYVTVGHLGCPCVTFKWPWWLYWSRYSSTSYTLSYLTGQPTFQTSAAKTSLHQTFSQHKSLALF